MNTNLLLPLTNLQRVTLIGEYSNVKFDLLSSLKTLSSQGEALTNKALQGDFSNILAEWPLVVLYHTNTAFFQDSLSLDLSGLNVFLPVETNNTLEEYYKHEGWYKDAAMSVLF